METIDDLLEKRQNKSLIAFMKLVDPERKFRIDLKLGDKWDALSLTNQRRLYLYLLYRKWRGEGFYGTPYEIISYCHPYPTNWDGRGQLLDELLKEGKSSPPSSTAPTVSTPATKPASGKWRMSNPASKSLRLLSRHFMPELYNPQI